MSWNAQIHQSLAIGSETRRHIRSDIKRSVVTAKSLASAALTMAALTIREQATYAGG